MIPDWTIMRAAGCGTWPLEKRMPMEEKKKPYIYLASPHMSKEAYEKEYVMEAFDTNWIAPLGKNVDELEKVITEKLGTQDSVALMTGTSALHLALKLIGIRRGDVVFCSSFTFAASANPIVYEGAKPVFIDSEESTWNMSPKALKRAFEKYAFLGTLPKAVIVVHLYGLSARMDEITELCRQYGCPLIEDAAESLGTKYQGASTGGEWKYTGTFGDYGILSFNGNKIITGSGGGMLLCNTPDGKEKAKKARFLATQAREPARWYQHQEIGYNYRMSNVMAGIVRGQLKVLKRRIRKKQEIYRQYQQQLGDLPGFFLMPVHDWEVSNCWLTAGRLADIYRSGKEKMTSIHIMERLEQEAVESRPVWKPLHLQPVFFHCDFVSESEELEGRSMVNDEMGADRSICGQIFEKGICLPSDTKMTQEDMERICGLIRQCWE